MKLKIIEAVFLTLFIIGCGEGSPSHEKNKELNASKVESNDIEIQTEDVESIKEIATRDDLIAELIPLKSEEELDDEAKDELESSFKIEEIDEEAHSMEKPSNELLDEERIEGEE